MNRPVSLAEKSQKIGILPVISFYITSIIGAGILVVPSIANHITGPSSVFAWILLAFASYPFAITFANISIEFPENSGIFDFLEKGFGRAVSSSLNFLFLISHFIGNPVIGIAAARYLLRTIGSNNDSLLYPIAFGFMCLSISFNALGIKLSSIIQTALLSLLVLSLFFVIGSAVPHARIQVPSAYFPNGFSAFLEAIVICFFSFIGWENVSMIAGEIDDPKRTFRKAIPIAIFLISVLYLLIAFAVAFVLPGLQDGSNYTLFSDLIRISYGEAGARIGSLVAVLLLFLSLNAWVMGASRSFQIAAKRGIAPRVFSKLDKRNKPLAALFGLTLPYIAVFWFLISQNLDEKPLIKMVNCNVLIIFVFVFLTAFLRLDQFLNRAWSLISFCISTFLVISCGWTTAYSVIIIALSYAWIRFKK